MMLLEIEWQDVGTFASPVNVGVATNSLALCQDSLLRDTANNHIIHSCHLL
jgi:mannose-1-phosphate guanylyltransferase